MDNNSNNNNNNKRSLKVIGVRIIRSYSVSVIHLEMKKNYVRTIFVFIHSDQLYTIIYVHAHNIIYFVVAAEYSYKDLQSLPISRQHKGGFTKSLPTNNKLITIILKRQR